MKDRIVQYPHRYQLVPVAGETNVYDFVPKTGTVTEDGTPINKENLLSDETAEMYCGVENVDEALKRGLNLSSYMAFCANVNADSLDSAFGKGNVENVNGIGLQLAMYSWFMGADKIAFPFTHLKTIDRFMDISSNSDAFLELTSDTNLNNIVQASPFASAQKATWNISPIIASIVGLDPLDFPDATTLMTADSTSLNAIFDNAVALKLFCDSQIVQDAFWSSKPAMLVASSKWAVVEPALRASIGGVAFASANLSPHRTSISTPPMPVYDSGVSFVLSASRYSSGNNSFAYVTGLYSNLQPSGGAAKSYSWRPNSFGNNIGGGQVAMDASWSATLIDIS